MWITPILTLMLLPKKAYSSTIDSIGYVNISLYQYWNMETRGLEDFALISRAFGWSSLNLKYSTITEIVSGIASQHSFVS